MTSEREQFYKRRIAELEKQVAELTEQVAELLKANAELTEQVIKLTEKVAKLSKNSSNSSKPPSSDIVKPPKTPKSKGPHRQGGQPGHTGVNRQPFTSEQIDKTIDLHPGDCSCGHTGGGQPLDKPQIQQVAELRPDPLFVAEYRLYGYKCPDCGRIVWAKLPDDVVEGQL